MGSLRGKLEPVESGVGGESLAFVLGIAAIFPFKVRLVEREREGWIAAEIIVIVEVLVAENESVDALGAEISNGVLDKFQVAAVLETICKSFNEATSLLDFPKNESSAAATGEMPALKIGVNIS